MGTRHLFALVISVLSLTIFAACGGGAGLTTGGELDGGESAIISESDGGGWSGLPEIPLDTEEDRAASEADDGYGFGGVLGKDYIQMQGGSVDGDALVLENYPEVDPDAGVELPDELSYGMYRISGLAGQRPLSLNIECIPGGLGEGYFVGIADYTTAQWRWFGPVSFPEAELDLYLVNHQLVTHLGNMYFMIVVPPGNSAIHSRSIVITGPSEPGTHPGIPHHLVATDGQLAEKVGLEWIGGNGASTFEVFRRAAWGDNTEWAKIGETTESRYIDQPLPDYRMFYYRVRSLNEAGESRWSNVDSGFAGGGDDPCVIRGEITTVMGEPVEGIWVGLVGFDEQMLRITDEQGKFYFGDLPPGKYIVAAEHPELVFAPPFHVVDLTEAKLADIHFNAMLEWSFHRVFGFAVTVAENECEDCPRIEPLPGVTMTAVKIGEPETQFTTTTDEHGFYLLEDLPEGVYALKPALSGMEFVPSLAEIVINGTNRPDRHDFLGVPLTEPGDPE